MVREPPMPKSFAGTFGQGPAAPGPMGGMPGQGEPTPQEQENFLKNLTDEQLLKLIEQDPKVPDCSHERRKGLERLKHLK